MNDITAEQAKLITDLESYKTVTGAQRFKRTKEEMEAGLSPDEALANRLAAAKGEAVVGTPHHVGGRTDAPLRASVSRKGDMTIQVRPAAKTDADYFEHLPAKPVEIVLDEHWYKWYDTLMSGPFEGDANKLMGFILDHGIGEVLTKFKFAADVQGKVPGNGAQSDLKSEAV